MTDDEIDTAKRLFRCTFWPGSYEKRFVRFMAVLAENHPDTELTEKQSEFLAKVKHRYRKQLSRIP